MYIEYMDKSQWHERVAFLKAKGWTVSAICRDTGRGRTGVSDYINSPEGIKAIEVHQNRLNSTQDEDVMEGLSAEAAAKVSLALEGEYDEGKYNDAINAMLKEDLINFDQRRANLLKVMLEERNRRQKANETNDEVVVLFTNDVKEALDLIRDEYQRVVARN